jgi:flagellar biosynthetic protein FliR
MDMSYQDLIFNLNRFMLPFMRISGFFLLAPVIASQLVSVRIRLIVSLAITWVSLGHIEHIPMIEPFSLRMIPLVFSELLIGIVLGFMVLAFIQIAAVAGQLIAMQMGMGFAMMMDPVNGVNTVTIGQLYIMVFTLLYLTVDGHLITMAIMLDSFKTIPIDRTGFDLAILEHATQVLSWMFKNAVKIALPAIIALYVVNFAFGVMSRAAQQLQIFSIGFPFTIIYGMVIIWITLGILLPQFDAIFSELLDLMYL